jgi:hypothetical protein
MLTGFIVFAVGISAIAYPLWWNHRSETTGNDLLREHLVVRHHISGPPGCTPSLPSGYSRSMHLDGILEIPSLSVRAPVLQGLSDSVLNVAAGPRYQLVLNYSQSWASLLCLHPATAVR